MNNLNEILILFSGISFCLYGSQVLISAKMREEFKRFGLEKFQKLTGIFQLLGGSGLLISWLFSQNVLLFISSGGLALLMFFGFAVRIKMKDSIWVTFPSLFFMLLNLYIFIIVLKAELPVLTENKI